jgi:XTP/dITP diphosphohydrolase
LALAQKVLQRVTRAGLPEDLIPDAVTTVNITADIDAENDLRTAVLEFMDTVRAVEKTIIGEVGEQEWRAYWPR